MIAVQGPLAREIVQAIANAPLPERMTVAPRTIDGADALVAGTGYTGEDGVELLLDPDATPSRLDARSCAAARSRPGSPRATRCAPRSATTSTATTSSTERGPIEAGLGWCCRSGGGYIGAEAVAAARASRAGRAARRRSSIERGVARAGRRASSAAASSRAAPTRRASSVGIGMAYLPAARAEPTARVRDRRPRRAAARARRAAPALEGVRREPLESTAPITGGGEQMAEASYPADLLYHPEHDWARIEGDVATFGITWHAQDALGEVVFFEPPRSARTLAQNEPYTEVESVKAVSDVIAPLSGEVIEVNDAARRDARGDQRRSLRGRLAGQGPARRRRARRRRCSTATRTSRARLQMTPLHRRHRRRPRGRCSRRSASRASTSCSPRSRQACACDRALDLPRRARRGRGLRAPARARRAQHAAPRTRSRSSAPACTTTTCRRVDRHADRRAPSS